MISSDECETNFVDSCHPSDALCSLNFESRESWTGEAMKTDDPDDVKEDLRTELYALKEELWRHGYSGVAEIDNFISPT